MLSDGNSIFFAFVLFSKLRRRRDMTVISEKYWRNGRKKIASIIRLKMEESKNV